MKIAIVTINNPSLEAAKRLLPYLNNHECYIFNKSQEGGAFYKFNKVDEILAKAWTEFDALIFLMATGAVIRKVAPYLKDKASDPALLIMTLDLKRVIPLVSGHLGGANELAEEIASKIDGCINFVTTASDQVEALAFDMFAKKHGFAISNLKALAEVSNAIINNNPVQVITYPALEKLVQAFEGYKEGSCIFFYPDNLIDLKKDIPSIYITPQKLANNALQIHPQEIVIGLGMNRGTSKMAIANAIKRFCYEHGLEQKMITKLASFEAKSNELGLLEFAKQQQIPLEFFDENEINALTQEFSPSEATKFFHIKGVAEPAALLASRYKTLFLNKRVYGAITIAAAI